ncbi:MAG: hypothetical protein VX446_03665, partial [Bacteroidota bacterium]|nr:hypothetical protein [Bacteroidota bacterium]
MADTEAVHPGHSTKHGPAFGAALRKQALLNAEPETFTITDFAVSKDGDVSDGEDGDWNDTELAVLKSRIKRRDERKRLQWEMPFGKKLGVALKIKAHKDGEGSSTHITPRTQSDLRRTEASTWVYGPFYGTMDFPEKQFDILRAESESFTPSFLRNWVLPFVQREQTIPLRLLGWLVVNYVKDNSV